jgi:hypothetical protein
LNQRYTPVIDFAIASAAQKLPGQSLVDSYPPEAEVDASTHDHGELHWYLFLAFVLGSWPTQMALTPAFIRGSGK